MAAEGLCLVFLLLAAWKDSGNGTIPNWLTGGTGLAGGLLALQAGALPVGFAAISMPITIGLGVLWACGWLGGGDVKATGVLALLLEGRVFLRVFVLSLPVSLVLLAFATPQGGRSRRECPFAVSLLAAFLVVLAGRLL